MDSPLEPENGFRSQTDSSPWSTDLAPNSPPQSTHSQPPSTSPIRETNNEFSSPDRKVGGLTPRSPQAERSERSHSQDSSGRINNINSGEILIKKEGFVRIKVIALEKNRRDIYIKFNAEVSRES